MDWAKAKDILIIALLITCLALGGILIKDYLKENKSERASIKTTRQYLISQGASLICDIPSGRPELPVLFIKFSEDPNIKQLERYSSYEVIKTGGDKLFAQQVSVGNNRAKIISASTALLTLSSELRNIEGLSIESVKLVYHIEAEGAQAEMQDTAMPAWQIKTSSGDYYINAYGQ